MPFDAEGFDRQIELPPELRVSHIRRSIEYIERESSDLLEVYFEQANVFSGLVGIFGVRALHSLSPYKKHKHPDVAQQRFPDLSLGGRLGPPPQQALESKGTTRPWALQSHYNHAGWYIVWRYLVDPTKIIKSNRSVVIWRVDSRFCGRKTGNMKAARLAKVEEVEHIPSGLGIRQTASQARSPFVTPRSFCVKADPHLRMVTSESVGEECC